MKKTTDLFGLFWQSKKENINITDTAAAVEWNESVDGHTMELSFDVPDIEEVGVTRHEIVTGDKIFLIFDGEVKYCFTVTAIARDWPRRRVTARDFGFYFEKNDIIMQFVNVTIKQAVEEICAKLGIKVKAPEMSAAVSGVYMDSAETVLEGLLERQGASDGGEYDYEMEKDVLVIYKLPTEPEEYRFKPAENVAEYDVTLYHTRAKASENIEDMKNSVTAVVKSNTEGNLPAAEYTVSDDESIKRYGLLRAKTDVSKDDIYRLGNIAKDKLRKEGKPETDFYVEMTGAINARRNRVMHIVDEYTGVDAFMRVKSVSQSLQGGIYKMNVRLAFIEENKEVKISESRIEREEFDISGKSVTYYDDAVGVTNFGVMEAEARRCLGVPYVWGGYSMSGFDCSGFVCYVLNRSGYDVGRTTAQGLFDMTKRVKSPQPGDLIFWTNTNPNSNALITHVGICIGNGKNIQASTSKGVCVTGNGGAYAYGRLGGK